MLLHQFSGRHVVLLQGPLGPFFRLFAKDLSAHGAQVTKINFCGGDELFYRGMPAVRYTDTLNRWPDFFTAFCRDHQVDAIFVLGDCRPYHRAAKEVATELGIAFYAFEEGYLRPAFITLEPGGVNGFSPTPKDPRFYGDCPWRPLTDHEPVGKVFGRSARYTIAYYVATRLLSWRYPHYVHHRPAGLLRHGLCWVRGFARKLWYAVRERTVLENLVRRWDGRFFLFPLQVHNDYQFVHSDYPHMEACIEDVIGSFAAHAPQDTALVIKHHPQDRPYKEYSGLIRQLAHRHQVADRVICVHDVHLPSLLRHARGTVVMNSTVGLSSVGHHTPTKVLARAVYDIPGLTHQGSLADFWRAPQAVNVEMYTRFRGWLEHVNQFNGNFYKPLKRWNNHCGVRWDTYDPEAARRGYEEAAAQASARHAAQR